MDLKALKDPNNGLIAFKGLHKKLEVLEALKVLKVVRVFEDPLGSVTSSQGLCP